MSVRIIYSEKQPTWFRAREKACTAGGGERWRVETGISPDRAGQAEYDRTCRGSEIGGGVGEGV